jgi:hypothetical protein
MRIKKLKFSIFLVVAFHYSLASQILDSLYLRALGLRVDLVLSSGDKYFEINKNTYRIKGQKISPIYRFVTNEELIKLTKKVKEGVIVHRMSHKLISKDTIDVNFSTFTATSKGKQLYCALHCGGTEAYQPDIRFAWRNQEQYWYVIENRFYSAK